MPITSTKDIIMKAFTEGYGVPAINVFNDLTMLAVLQAAEESKSPVIVQTSVKTVRTIGSRVISGMWASMTYGLTVPVALHLDHCPDRSVLTECLRAGWNSVLFDASALSLEENQKQTIAVVREAHEFGANVEGEIESITGIEDGIGADYESRVYPNEVAAKFVHNTGVDIFAPSIGNSHGRYRSLPKLNTKRINDLVKLTGIPMALHGGSGLSAEQFRDLISRGCAKVNISTTLKERYMKANLSQLEKSRAQDIWDPPTLFRVVTDSIKTTVKEHIDMFGSGGKA